MVTNKHSQDSKENKKCDSAQLQPRFLPHRLVQSPNTLFHYNKVETGFEVICHIFTQINLNYFKNTCINNLSTERCTKMPTPNILTSVQFSRSVISLSNRVISSLLILPNIIKQILSNVDRAGKTKIFPRCHPFSHFLSSKQRFPISAS